MNLAKTAIYIVAAATMALAQESGIHVRTIRVLATDPEAIATFYEKSFRHVRNPSACDHGNLPGDRRQLRLDG